MNNLSEQEIPVYAQRIAVHIYDNQISYFGGLNQDNDDFVIRSVMKNLDIDVDKSSAELIAEVNRALGLIKFVEEKQLESLLR